MHLNARRNYVTAARSKGMLFQSVIKDPKIQVHNNKAYHVATDGGSSSNSVAVLPSHFVPGSTSSPNHALTTIHLIPRNDTTDAADDSLCLLCTWIVR